MTTQRKPFSPRAEAPPPIPIKQAWMQDIIWGRPVFRAPELPTPRRIFEPLPLLANRITHPLNEEVQV